VEAARLARLSADDPDQRRPLSDGIGQADGMTGPALLFEERRAISRLGLGQSDLCAGQFHHKHCAAKSEPNCLCRPKLCHLHHRSRAQILGRAVQAVVVAGCFTREQIGAVSASARYAPWPAARRNHLTSLLAPICQRVFSRSFREARRAR
jgi:hypothetical protein